MSGHPLIARTLGETVVAAFRDSILRQEFAAGSRLTDVSLAERWGVSRATVRDALRQLTYEGLVVSSPHRGYFVAEFSPTDVLELLDLRGMLEGRAAEAAVRHLTDDDFACLNEISDEIERLDYRVSVLRIRDLDINFHQIVTRRSGKPLLLELWSTLNSRLFMLDAVCRDVLQLNARDSADRHRFYIEELRPRDPRRAREAGEEHYRFHAERYREMLAEAETVAGDATPNKAQGNR